MEVIYTNHADPVDGDRVTAQAATNDYITWIYIRQGYDFAALEPAELLAIASAAIGYIYRGNLTQYYEPIARLFDDMSGIIAPAPGQHNGDAAYTIGDIELSINTEKQQ